MGNVLMVGDKQFDIDFNLNVGMRYLFKGIWFDVVSATIDLDSPLYKDSTGKMVNRMIYIGSIYRYGEVL